MPKDKEVKLTTGQRITIAKLQNGTGKIYVSRFSDNKGICGTDISVNDSGLDFLIDNGYMEYSHDDEINNYWKLTTLGKSIKL